MGMNTLSALSVPTTMSYEGYLTDSSGTALTGTYSMVFSLYTASSGGSAIWTETQGSVSVSEGYFAVQLGSETAINLDFDQQYYLGINVEGDGEMTPRYTINSTAYARSADIAFGVYTDADAPSSFDGALYYDTDNGSIYIYDGVSEEWQEIATGSGGVDDLDDAYDNIGASAAKIIIDASESQTGGLEFESQVSDNIIFDLQSTGNMVVQDAGTAFLTFNDDDSIDYTTDLTTTDAWQLSGDSLTSGDLVQLSATSLEGGDAIQITTNGTLTGYAINIVSGDALFSDDVFIGGASETLSNVGFSLGGDDLFVADDVGVEGDIYTDESLIFGSGLTVTDGSLTQATGSSLSVALGGAAGDDFIVDTSTLVVESDNDRVGIGDTTPAAMFTVGSGDLFQIDSSGNVTTTKRVETAAHANNVGLNIPTNAGAPSAVTGTAEGDIVWDTTGDALYIYDGSSFSSISGGSSNADTLDSLDSTQFVRTDASSVITTGTLKLNDDVLLALGTGVDFWASSDGSDTIFENNNGDLIFDNHDSNSSIITRLGTDTTATSYQLRNNSDAQLITAYATGNVGIGDTTPDQLLEVHSSGTAATQLTLKNTNAGAYDAQIGFQLVDGTNNFTLGVDDSALDAFKIGTTGVASSTFFQGSSSGQFVELGDVDAGNNGLSLRVDNSNQKVEFGDLEETNNGVMFELNDSTEKIIMGVSGSNTLTLDTATDELELTSPNANRTQLAVVNTNAGNYDAQIGFQLVDGTNNWTIGVDDSETDSFSVSSTALGTGTIFRGNSTAVSIGDVDQGNNAFQFRISDTERTVYFGDLDELNNGMAFLLNDDERSISFGDVADANNGTKLNIDEPNNHVSIEGGLYLTQSGYSGTTNGVLRYTGTDFEGRVGDAWESLTSGGGGGGSPGGSDGQLQYNNGGSFGGTAGLVWDDGSNRLGIGDTTPDQLLEVLSSGAAATQVTIANTNAGTYDAQIGFELGDTGTNLWTIGVDDSDSDKFKIGRSTVASNTALTIDSTGNVGIGGYNASADVYIQATGDIYVGDGNEDDNGIHLNIDSTNEYLALGDPYLARYGQTLEINGDTLFLGDLEEQLLVFRTDLTDEQLVIGHYEATEANMNNSIIIDNDNLYQKFGDFSTTDGIALTINVEENTFTVDKYYTSISKGYAGYFNHHGDDADLHGLIVDAGADAGTGTTYYLTARDGDGDIVGQIQNSGGTFSLQDVSDVRTKTNISDTEVAGLDVVRNLRVVDFNRKSNPNGERITGFIAQEVQPVYDKIVSANTNGLLSISKENLVPVLVKGMQEQQNLIEELQGQISGVSLPNRGVNISVSSGEFSSNNVGRAKVKAGNSVVHVSFDNPFRHEPIITVTPIGIQDHKYAPENITRSGFDIRIEGPATNEIIFNWHAFSSPDAKLYVSDGTLEYLDLHVEDNEQNSQDEEVENEDDMTQNPEDQYGDSEAEDTSINYASEDQSESNDDQTENTNSDENSDPLEEDQDEGREEQPELDQEADETETPSDGVESDDNTSEEIQ
jgi:hypothetical protein